MRDNPVFRWLSVLVIISFLFSSCTDGKGFGGGRGGGGGFKGGSRGGGSFGRSKGTGTFGGSSNYNRPRSGSSFKSNAMSFGAGALGGIAAYSLMSSMSSSYRQRPGYYEPGYGGGDTCVNNEDINGTRFGSFRCPLNGFPYEAKYCCGDYGKQYCCIREGSSIMRGASSVGWIFLVIVVLLIIIFLFVRHRRQKHVIMVPTEPPANEQQGPPFYHPPPPPMGYPPPPMSYPLPPQNGNPYAVPPQNYEGNFNPYSQQQYQMPYPPQQQPYNPYQVKEGGPPAYDDAIRNNQGVPTTKPT